MKKLFVLSIMLISAFLSAKQIGEIKKIAGKVYIQVPGEAAVKAKVGVKVEEGFYIITKEKSTAIIMLFSGSEITVRPNTKMKVMNNAIKNREGNTTSLSLNMGSIKCRVSKLAAGSDSFDVYTPTAVAGVRGTDFSVATGIDGSSQVAVESGKVNLAGEETGAVDLGENQAADAILGDTASLQAKSAEDEDVGEFLEGREEVVEKDPVGTLEKMEDYLTSVEKRAQTTADAAAAKEKVDAPADQDAYLQQQNEGKEISSDFNAAVSANEGILAAALAVQEKAGNSREVKKHLSAIENINRSINSYNERVEAALARLDKRLQEAYERINKSFDDNSKRLDESFGEKEDSRFNMDF